MRTESDDDDAFAPTMVSVYLVVSLFCHLHVFSPFYHRCCNCRNESVDESNDDCEANCCYCCDGDDDCFACIPHEIVTSASRVKEPNRVDESLLLPSSSYYRYSLMFHRVTLVSVVAIVILVAPIVLLFVVAVILAVAAAAVVVVVVLLPSFSTAA